MRTAPLLLLLAPLGACSVAKITIGGDDTSVGTPQLTLGSTLLDFGSVPAGMGGSAKVLDLSNTGDATLQILGFSVDDPTAPFTISDVGSTELAPGESTGIILNFTPMVPGSYGANLQIASNDPDEIAEVVLVGESADSGLVLEPSSYDFGVLTLGCSASVDVALHNIGGSAITVENVLLSGADGELSVNEGTPLPWTIGGDQSQAITLTYTPTLQHVVFGSLLVSTTSSTTPTVTGTYFGEAQASPEASERFTTPDGVLDFVVFVDKTQSMQDAGYVNTFRSNMSTIYDALVESDTDFQFAIVTDDDGCVNGPNDFITPSMTRSQMMATLSAMFDSSYYGGELAEEGFSILYAATRPEATSERACNEGLVRSSGALALVGISDEDEQSDGDATGWVAALTSLKSDPTRVHMNGIVGDLPSGCEEAKAGSNWATVAQLTGGATYSICDSSEDWALNLQDIVRSSAGLGSTYTLSSEAEPGTIVVRIDGRISYDWTYDDATNSVVFTSAAGLTWNEDIDISYTIAQTCTG